MALFISFEGGEGSGKSTQAKLLYGRLADMGLAVEFVHEPGSTELGWRVREILKRGLSKEHAMSDYAELMLFSAARAELVVKMLKPRLAQSSTVIVADRYVDSTLAYQGYGRGLPLDKIAVVNALATQGVMPDLTFLLDIAPMDGLARIGGVQLGFQLGDAVHSVDVARAEEGARFEDEPLEFHERVWKGYHELVRAEPDRWQVIDAAQPQRRISDRIWETLRSRFPESISQVEEAKK